MVVIIDAVDDKHFHTMETDPALSVKVEHPNGSGLVGVDELLIYYNSNPTDREKGGWHVTTLFPGETEPVTRWQRMVRACNAPDATDQAKSLGLHE